MKTAYQFFRTFNPSSGFRLILIAAFVALLAITCSPAGGGSGGGGTTTVATPDITPGDTTNFEQDTPVAITCSTIGAAIWYTTDGSTPSATNPTAILYAGAIPAETFAEGSAVNITIRAIGILAGSTDSAVAQAVYANVVDTIGPVPAVSSIFDAIGIVAAPFALTVTFNETVTGFDDPLTDLVVANGTAGAISGGPRVYQSLITPITDDVAVTVDIPSGAADDASAALNPSQAAVQFTIMYNDDAPQGVITSTLSPGPTNTSSIPVQIDFSMNVVNFTAGDLTVGNGTAGTLSGGPQVYIIDIAPTADGSVTVDIAGNVCLAQADNTPNIPSAQFSIDYDGTAPSITGIAPASGGLSSSNPLAVQIDWNEAVSGFDEADITPTLTNCTIQPASWTQVTASQYTFTLVPSGEAAFSFQVNAGVCTDNVSNPSVGPVAWIHTYSTAPLVGAPDLAAGSDSGSSNTDNITSNLAPEFSGTCNKPGTLEILSDVDGLLYSGAITGDWGPIAVAITTASGQTGTVHNITARVTDSNSVTGSSAPLSITIDVTAPATISTPDLEAASDLGVSTADDITSDLTPGFSVTTDEAGSLEIRSSRDGGVFSGSVASGLNSGLTVSSLSFGTAPADQAGVAHTMDARLTDTAGNQGSWSGALVITVDGIAPSVSAPDLVYTSDSGVDTDNITNDTTPDFNGTTTEDGALAIISSVDGTVGTGVASGSWGPVTASTLDATGQTGTAHTMSAQVTDLAGNTGVSTGLSITFDSTGPVVSVPDLDSGADSGSSNSDNITNDQTPSFSGTANEDGDLTLRADGTTTVSGIVSSGAYSVVTMSNLAAVGQTGQAHSIDARVTDTAGNTGSWCSTLSVTVDITAPTVGQPDMDAGSDSGGSNSDNLTNDTTPSFTGTSNEAGTLDIMSSVDGSRYANSVAGNWTSIALTSALDAVGQTGHSHNIWAEVEDAAGNSGTSTALAVVIDNTAPTVTIDQNGAQADPTSVSPIAYDIVFVESAITFATGDVAFTGSTAGGTLAGAVSGGPDSYSVSVTGMTTAGDVVASIASSVCTDTAGNANAASDSTDNTVTFNSSYTVTYSGNGNTGGSAPTDGNSYISGNTVTVLGNTGSLTKTGSSFVGWCVNADGSGTSYTPGNTFTMGSSNVTLYAKWTALPTYNVTYAGNGNTGGTVPVDSTSYVEGSNVTVMGNTGGLVRTGYSFVGWDDLAASAFYTPGNQFVIDGNITLTAKWSANPTYTVTYIGNGNTGGTVPTDGTNYEYGALVTVLGNTGNLTRTGYNFTGWNTAANGSGTSYSGGNTFNMGSANVSLYAQWSTLPTYIVTYNGNGSTGGNVPTDSTNYLTGETVSVLGNTGSLVRTGYAFTGWNTLASGLGTTYNPSQTFTMGTSNVILYALWAADSASSWTDLHSASLPYAPYDAVATSSDGAYVFAVIRDGSGTAAGIYRSTNSGSTWARPATAATARAYRCVAASSTGQYVIAGVSTGNIYVSTNYGATWAASAGAGSRAWRGVTMSSDGSIWYGLVNGGGVWRSANYGTNWTQVNTTARAYYAAHVSSDGTTLAAAVNNGGLYVSTDSGTTMTLKLSMAAAWRGVYISDNGQIITGVIQAGTYPNSGVWVCDDPTKAFTTWTQTDSNSVSYRCIAMSSDGSKMGVGIKGTTGGYVSFSSNFGANWYSRTYTGMLVWTGIAASSTGARFYVTNSSGGSGGSVWVYVQ